MELPGALGRRTGSEAPEFTRTVRKVADDVFEHDDLGLSAETAYHALLGFFPFLLLLGSVLSGLTWLIDKDTLVKELAGQVEGTAPEDVSSTFQKVLDDLLTKGGVVVGVVGGLFALWSGSNAVASLIKGLNRIYGSSSQGGMLEERLKGVAFLLLFLLAFVAAQVLIVGSSYLSEELGLIAGAPVEISAWVLAFLVTALSVGIFYRLAPAQRDEKNEAVITVGALVFALSWLTFMVVYTAYLSAFGGPTSALGIIGFVILLMVWFFWTAFSILLGAEVDHRLGQQVEASESGGLAQG